MPDFHEGVMHNHQPSGRWSEVQKNPNSPEGGVAVTICQNCEPATVVWFARKWLWDCPLALRHIDWYLKGTGRDFVEDNALKIVLENDRGIQGAIGRRLPDARKSGTYKSQFKVEQKHYSLDDAKNSWGAIDILEFEANYDAGTLHVWFKDRYEWHPCYPGLYMRKDGDFPRETNCVHAAFVEMKSEGAADFWMIGEATVDLRLVVKSGGIL